MEDDGFFWKESGPKSTLGHLWLKALVMVGRSKLEGKYCKVGTVPVELRQPLSELLSYSPFPPSPWISRRAMASMIEVPSGSWA
jgi:hypothetical protein